MEIRARMREAAPGLWRATASLHGTPDRELVAEASTREACLAELRREVRKALRVNEPAAGAGTGAEVTLMVEVVPRLAGVAEAAEVMGWDKRRVITYLDRGRFPEPVQALASGRVWIRSDLEDFGMRWRARQVARRSRRGLRAEPEPAPPETPRDRPEPVP